MYGVSALGSRGGNHTITMLKKQLNQVMEQLSCYEIYDLKNTIYMGDGIFDWILMKKVLFSISCADSNTLTKKYSNYSTKAKSGERAVSEACLFIIKKFFLKKGDSIENILLRYLKN